MKFTSTHVQLAYVTTHTHTLNTCIFVHTRAQLNTYTHTQHTQHTLIHTQVHSCTLHTQTNVYWNGTVACTRTHQTRKTHILACTVRKAAVTGGLRGRRSEAVVLPLLLVWGEEGEEMLLELQHCHCLLRSRQYLQQQQHKVCVCW